MSQLSFAELFQKYINQTCTPAEVDQLFVMMEKGEEGMAAQELLKQQLQDGLEPTGYTDDAMRQRLQNRFVQIEQQITPPNEQPKRRSLVWRWAVAAAIIILAGGGIGYWLTVKKPVATTAPQQMEILPGSDKAQLTIADGKTITLDNTGAGVIGREGQTTINQQGGALIYEASKAPAGELMYNELTTPRGGQYQLTLPDGSKVWLNAASSIRFPVVFNETERVVYVMGEVYFEVNHQTNKSGKQIPFIVKLPPPAGWGSSKYGKGSDIQVLGTRFNVNAYDEKDAVRTTLLEGSVKVRQWSMVNGQLKAENEALLNPGEQAALAGAHSPFTINHSPNLEQVMAWKNGLFRFDGVELKTMMRQLSRWYDVDISFEKGAPVTELYNGAIQRSLQLSQVLKGMNDMGIHVKQEGKRLIVMP